MVIGVPTTKCIHGVFKAGEETARYCGFCNPNMTFMALRRSTVKIALVHEQEEELADCVEFMERNPGARLAALGY